MTFQPDGTMFIRITRGGNTPQEGLPESILGWLQDWVEDTSWRDERDFPDYEQRPLIAISGWLRWSTIKTDVAAISYEHPDLPLVVDIRKQDGQLWRMYAIYGFISMEQPQIVYPPMDWADLAAAAIPFLKQRIADERAESARRINELMNMMNQIKGE